MKPRGHRSVIVGVVTSDKMDKTIVIKHERLVKHPKYGKYLKRAKKYMAHDEEGQAKVGDLVEIIQARPLSRRKCWRLVRVVRGA